MKRKIAIYFAAFVMLFTGVSCMNDDAETVVLSPYAMMTSFSLGNIKSSYADFTSTGEDTTVVRTISTGAYPFTIDQLTGEVFNVDSLPFGTDVSKLVVNISVKGTVGIYNDSTETYDYFESTDSLDFTRPRNFRVYAPDTQYARDYTVAVNVHQVEPELMAWDKYGAAVGFAPEGAVEYNAAMKLFGTLADGSFAVASTSLDGEPSWETVALRGLPAVADLSNVQQFAGALYVAAEGDLYSSADAVNWTVASQGVGAEAIVAASDADGKIWIAGQQGVKYSTNGVDFQYSEDLPARFPLYGLSLASYPLAHNGNITRYMLVGYATPEKDGDVYVWSRLSTENEWVQYDNGNGFGCPGLNNLSVVRYDNFLYAFGGSGVVSGIGVNAFEKFFVSKDNGIVWKASNDFYKRLPGELAGDESQFAAAVDSGNRLWIVTSGDNACVWRGMINRLGFNK